MGKEIVGSVRAEISVTDLPGDGLRDVFGTRPYDRFKDVVPLWIARKRGKLSEPITLIDS
jgi:hypothetical protein